MKLSINKYSSSILPFWGRGLVTFAVLLLSSFFVLKKEKPTLFLIGDSTVRNGTYGRGDGGLWGWGSFLHLFLDTDKISIQNRALGGTSSHSYAEMGLWDKVLADIKPGDYVLMQFGHNDNGKNAIRNNSEDTLHYINPKTGKEEVVHSYGWNMRRYIREAKAKGAIPVVLSLVPRNLWTNGKINRSTNDFVLWAHQAADQEGALFIDLNGIIADRYDADGETKVRATYFNTSDHTHTIEAGAKVNAACVTKGLETLEGKLFTDYINQQAVKEYGE